MMVLHGTQTPHESAKASRSAIRIEASGNLNDFFRQMAEKTLKSRCKLLLDSVSHDGLFQLEKYLQGLQR
jgi:hypothetical protein